MSMKIYNFSGTHRNLKKPRPLYNTFGLRPTALWNYYSWRHARRSSV